MLFKAAGKKQPKPATKLKPLFWAKFNAQVRTSARYKYSSLVFINILELELGILERN